FERGYPGFQEIREDRLALRRYRHLQQVLSLEAEGANAARCRTLLETLAGFFQDERIVLMSSAAVMTMPVTRTLNQAEMTQAPELPKLAARWTPERVEFRLRREGNLDPIEGLWRDDKGQFAIVYDDAIPRGEYVAFRFDY